MTREIDGNLIAQGKSFAVVAARWNERFGEELVGGAVDSLVRHGADEDDVLVVRCPGSFELTQAAVKVAETTDVDAIICLGVLIRGETPHFDYIAGEATSGIGSLGAKGEVPVTFGLLTCNTMEQAMARSGAKYGNKGEEAALAAIEMANLYEQLERQA